MLVNRSDDFDSTLFAKFYELKAFGYFMAILGIIVSGADTTRGMVGITEQSVGGSWLGRSAK